ncbi:MAG: RNA polymerase factor sigma-54, partial [Pirellulaceae bacterium]
MHKLCERIISSLDARDGGYLRSSLRDLMPPDATEADLEAAESALRIVQSLDPPGIAARDLRECLLLQLHPDMLYYEELRQLISDHLEDLKENRLPAIHKATGMTIEEIREVWDELRKLNPKPASGFSETFVPTVTPDVRIEQVDDGTYKVIVDEDRTPQLYISEYYRQRLATGQATPEEKEYIKRKITAAQWLIESIQQRRNTLTKVAQAIVDYQRRFLDEGPEHIEPLKMQQIAEQVGVHVTTVSRAVDDKWIQTPRGILPLRKFFVGGTRSDGGEDIAWDTIRIKLQDLIDREDKSNPYSDDQLVRELKKQGLNVARRTITKYREKMGIPSSRQRRDWSKAAAGTAARPSDVEAETVNRAAETPAEDEFDTDSSTGRQSGSDSREPAFAARTSAGRDTMFRDAASPDGAGRHGLARDAASGDGARRDSDYPQPAPARPALGGSHENGSAAALRSPAIRQEELGEQPLLNTREPSEYPPHGGPPMSAQRSDSLIAEAATTDKGNSAPTDRPPAPLPAARPGLPGVGAGVATMGPLSAGQSFAPLRSATEPVRELPPVRGANNDEAALREPESPASPREGDGFRPE